MFVSRGMVEGKESCRVCEVTIEVGRTMYLVEECVRGQERLVPLEPGTRLCSWECLARWVRSDEVQVLPRKVP